MEKILQLLAEQREKLERIEAMLSGTKKVFNLKEVCFYTGLSESHMYKLTCTSQVPFYKKGKHLFFDRDEIEAWLKESPFRSFSDLEKDAASYTLLNRKRGVL